MGSAPVWLGSSFGSSSDWEVASSSRNVTETGVRSSVKRTGLASLLFAMLRPGEAKEASVNAESVKLAFGSRHSQTALGDIEAVEAKVGRRWARLRLRHAAGTAIVSGLLGTGAKVLSDVVETARTEWWRRTLAPQIGALRSVYERLAELVDPPKYVNADAFGELARNAQAAVGYVVGRWPEAYCWTTLRDHLGLPVPANRYARDS